MEHSVVNKRDPSHVYAGYGVEVGGFLTAAIVMTHTTSMFRHVMVSQARE